MSNVNQQEFEKLVELVIDLNLTIPCDYRNNINRKMNVVETQLEKMGINPRSKRFKMFNKQSIGRGLRKPCDAGPLTTKEPISHVQV